MHLLEELGKLLKNPIGKSGVNHRLRKNTTNSRGVEKIDK